MPKEWIQIKKKILNLPKARCSPQNDWIHKGEFNIHVLMIVFVSLRSKGIYLFKKFSLKLFFRGFDYILKNNFWIFEMNNIPRISSKNAWNWTSFPCLKWTNNNDPFSSTATTVYFSYMKISQKAEWLLSTLCASSVRKLFPSAVSAKKMKVLCTCMCGSEDASSLSWTGPWEREIDNIPHFTRRLSNCCSPLCTQNSTREASLGWMGEVNGLFRGILILHSVKGERKVKNHLCLATG